MLLPAIKITVLEKLILKFLQTSALWNSTLIRKPRPFSEEKKPRIPDREKIIPTWPLEPYRCCFVEPYRCCFVVEPYRCCFVENYIQCQYYNKSCKRVL